MRDVFLGLLVLGRKFAATTILSTFVYPIALEMIQRLSNGFVITTDPVLCTVFGGLCIGAAIGIVIRTGRFKQVVWTFLLLY